VKRPTETVADAVELVELLADTGMLRVFAALVLGARPTPEVAERAGLPLRDAVRRLTRLEEAGLAARAGDGWHACPERLREAALAAAPDEAAAAAAGIPAHVPPAEAAVLRTYLTGGRIEQLPAQRAKRLVVLDHVAGAFEPGVRYTDHEVATILARFTTNVAGVRRLLLDEGFLGREADMYWRTGGTFLV
jgi:hypothetical protein